jgi:hypothetical protein
MSVSSDQNKYRLDFLNSPSGLADAQRALRLCRQYYSAGVQPTADATKKCRLSALHNDGI